jgi:hypothetical protein
MSVTIAHRPHVRVPRLPTVAVPAIAVAAALVLVLSMRTSTTTPATTHADAIGAGSVAAWTADVPKNRSPAFLAVLRGETRAAAPQTAAAPLRKSAHAARLTGEGDASGYGSRALRVGVGGGRVGKP